MERSNRIFSGTIPKYLHRRAYPIPYPSIAKAGDTDKGSKKVKVDGNPICLKDSNFKTSTGDEAGTLKGVASSKNKGKAEFINYSFDVKIEGKNVPRAFDMMLHNDKTHRLYLFYRNRLLLWGWMKILKFVNLLN